MTTARFLKTMVIATDKKTWTNKDIDKYYKLYLSTVSGVDQIETILDKYKTILIGDLVELIDFTNNYILKGIIRRRLESPEDHIEIISLFIGVSLKINIDNRLKGEQKCKK